MNRDPDIFDEIKSIEDSIVDFKSAQRVGADSLVVYNNQTSNRWDIDGAVISDQATEAKWFVIFIPTTKNASYAELEVEKYISQGATSYDELYVWDNAYTPGISKSFIVWIPGTYQQQTVNMKFGVRATSLGTINVQRIV